MSVITNVMGVEKLNEFRTSNYQQSNPEKKFLMYQLKPGVSRRFKLFSWLYLPPVRAQCRGRSSKIFISHNNVWSNFIKAAGSSFTA